MQRRRKVGRQGPAMTGLLHATLDRDGDGEALAPAQHGRLEGRRVSTGHASGALTARPSFFAQTEPAVTAARRVLEPLSPMLSELRRLRDALREQANEVKALLARPDEDPAGALNGASGVRGGCSSSDAQVVAAAIAALSVAGPSSRALSRLQERRDALRELVDQAKGCPPTEGLARRERITSGELGLGLRSARGHVPSGGRRVS